MNLKQYILKKSNGDEITGTRDMLAIRLENGIAKPDWLVREEDSSVWITLAELIASTSSELEPLQASQSKGQASSTNLAQSQSPEVFLQLVRRQTCYSTLRDMIGLLAVLSIIGTLILAGLYIFSGVKNENTIAVIVGVIVGLLGVFFVFGSKQASLLLVDIADTLIEQNRKK